MSAALSQSGQLPFVPTLGSPVDLLAMLVGLAVLPVLAISVTSFTRIVVVLGLLRAAMGSAGLPPNTVIVALAIMLSAAIMSPTLAAVDRQALAPYRAHRLSASQAIERAQEPLRLFMAKQTRASDIRAFARIAHERPQRASAVSLGVLLPAFLVGELRTAFTMGFVLALPFAAIDLVVAVALMSLGMFMVSPNAISLPVKLLLFVAVDGWTLVAGALAASFR